MVLPKMDPPPIASIATTDRSLAEIWRRWFLRFSQMANETSDLVAIAAPPGKLALFAGNAEPAGWLICDGRQVSRIDYANLFLALGTAWGPGDGITTFNLPDLRGRAAIGAGLGPGLTDRLFASTGGEENHLLTVGELPAHAHGVTDPGHAHGVTDPGHQHTIPANTVFTKGGTTEYEGSAPNQASSNAVVAPTATTGVTVQSNSTGITTQATGGDQAHNNMQPYAALHFIVKT